MKQKIAVFLPKLSGGGAERAMLNLCVGLMQQGFSVELVLAEAKGEYINAVPEGVVVIDLKCPRTIASLPRLVGYLRSARPNGLISALNHSNVIAIIASKLAGGKVPVGVSVQNTLSKELATQKPHLQWAMPRLMRFWYPKANVIGCVSRGVADDLAEHAGIERSKIGVINNPVVSDTLVQRAQEPVDHPWFAPGQPPVLICVGRLNVQKDHVTLLKAFKQVRAKVNCRLFILGEGELRADIEKLIKDLGLTDDVCMPGFADNPYAYMNKARVLVLSSIFEGLPTVLIEGLAAGTPVVSTDCPSGPVEILEGGRYGKLVPVSNPDALAAALVEELAHEKTLPEKESWAIYTYPRAADAFVKALGLA